MLQNTNAKEQIYKIFTYKYSACPKLFGHGKGKEIMVKMGKEHIAEHLNLNNADLQDIVEENIIFLITIKSSVAYIDDQSTIRQALEKMRSRGYTALPVLSKDGKYVGTVNEGDFLWHILDKKSYTIKDQEKYIVSDILRQGWNPAVSINASISEVLELVSNQNFVPVVDDREKFMGIITRKSVMNYYQKMKIILNNI
jgi:predicted transcriptional regulator